ncbi:MAG: rhodanese-like domain-containing protein [Nitrospiria bacterium]
MRTWKDLIDEAKQEISLLQTHDVKEKLERGDEFILIDVREQEEAQRGRIEKSIFIPRGVLEMTVQQHFKDPLRPIVLYCAGGGRSAVAAQALKKMGYEDVASMEGGFEGWKRSGLPVEH